MTPKIPLLDATANLKFKQRNGCEKLLMTMTEKMALHFSFPRFGLASARRSSVTAHK